MARQAERWTLYRNASGKWRIVWAQDLCGRRPWTWGVDTRMS
ncbi:MAG TPA: hypothetical protein VFW13_02740 [Phenylobacterium sp.]|nr:hypothetical protein [Phenylobacterium sp.]